MNKFILPFIVYLHTSIRLKNIHRHFYIRIFYKPKREIVKMVGNSTYSCSYKVLKTDIKYLKAIIQ